MTMTASRPSDARRQALQNEVDNFSSVSNFFSIEKYYDLAQKVHDSFQQSFETAVPYSATDVSNEALLAWDNAYVYGKRYCKFVIDGIAKHNYYNSPKYKHSKYQHNNQVNKALQQLEMAADAMDQQERECARLQAKLEQQRREAAAKLEAKKYQDLQQRARQLGQPPAASTASQSSDSVGASALSKLKLLGATQPSQTQQSSQQQVGTGRVRSNGINETDRTIKRDPSGEEPSVVPTSTSRYRLLSDSEDDDNEHEEKKSNNHHISHPLVLPPPVPPPSGSAAPPSYNQALAATQRNGRYHRTFLGPQVDDASSSSVGATRPAAMDVGEPKAKRRAPLKPMRELKEQYRVDYIKAQEKSLITIEGIDTYQGRVGQSTNGCTVISALVAARHLMSSATAQPISDASVCDVIDRQCGPLLREIRGKLGLGGHALIIPSDVHDHLVDKQILQQDLFEGAAGGNVMDPNHMEEFLKLLSDGDDGKGAVRRAAATLFFREHVISIVKTPTSDPNVVRYDLIDSLPTQLFSGRTRATRTVCWGRSALQILLAHYTSRKFSDTDCSYIDRNAWDDTMADCDPRVFQGFVWSQKTTTSNNNNKKPLKQ